MSESIAFTLEKVHSEFLGHLENLELEPILLADSISFQTGEIGGAKVQMTTRRWKSNVLESLTEALLRDSNGKLISVTLSAVPQAEFSLPILGVDYVGFRGVLSLVALDLCPTYGEFWSQTCEGFMKDQKKKSGELIQRKIPDFTLKTFSPYAIFSASKTDVQMAIARELAQAHLNHYFSLFSSLPCIEKNKEIDSNFKLITQWKHSMLKNKKEHSALSRIFGEEFTESYLKGFLFA